MGNRNKKVEKKFYRNKSDRNRRSTKCTDDRTLAKDINPNDLSWYVVDDQILNDAARIPYSIPVGMPFNREGTFTPNTGVAHSNYDHAIPGMLVSKIMPMLGPASSAGDPVNVAANSVYQYVRSRISGSRPYNAVDIMIYLGALDSLYCVLTWITRLYATVFTYHQANRYLSRALIEAQGIDYDDLVTNLSTFRQRVNVLIAKVRGLYLPSILPIFQRHSWLFSHYYIEGDNEKDQIYFHVPAGFHRFTYDNDGAGMLLGRRFDSSMPITTTGLINTLNYLIDPIYADEDFNRISGDLLKAYEGNVFTLTEIPDIATVQFIHNEEVLLQFKNAKYMMVSPATSPDSWAGGFFDYVQDTTKTFLQFGAVGAVGALHCVRPFSTSTNSSWIVGPSDPQIYKDALSAKMWEWSRNTLLTSPHADVTPGENMINTRLTLSVTLEPAANDYSAEFNDLSFGTEWPLTFELFAYHRDRSTNVTSMVRRVYEHVMYLDFTASNAEDVVQQLIDSQWPIISAFKYVPEILLNFIGPNMMRTAGRPIFEVDNYALVNHSVIVGLHSSAILGEYNIPKLSVGK